MPGDVVRRLIAGKDTQRGYCRSVKVCAAVQIVGTKKVIPNVTASDLVPVQVMFSSIFNFENVRNRILIYTFACKLFRS